MSMNERELEESLRKTTDALFGVIARLFRSGGGTREEYMATMSLYSDDAWRRREPGEPTIDFNSLNEASDAGRILIAARKIYARLLVDKQVSLADPVAQRLGVALGRIRQDSEAPSKGGNKD